MRINEGYPDDLAMELLNEAGIKVETIKEDEDE